MNFDVNCSSFFAIIDTFNNNSRTVLDECKNSKLHGLLKELYGALRQYSSISFKNLEEKYKKIIILFIELNLKIIINSDLPAETPFLSSTCLLVVLQKVWSSKFCCDFIVFAFFVITDACIIAEEKDKEQYISKMLENFNSWDKEIFNQDLHPYINGCKLWCSGALCEKNYQSSMFPRLYLLHGIVHGVSSSKTNLLLCKMSDYDVHFLISMFDPIHQCCISPCSAQYHAFSILFNWLKLCENLLSDLHSSSETQPYFSPSSKIIKNSLLILEANWESPIQGVTGFIKEIYKMLIKISDEESKLINSESIVAFLLEKTMKLSWNLKGKYLVLSTIIPHLHYKKFLEDYPEAPAIIISNLRVNYSSSITGEVYKSIVLSMKKDATPEELIVKWNNYWLDPIAKSLFTNDKLLIQNIKNIILPWTIKIISGSYVQLLKTIQESKENKHIFELVLLRIAKECSVCSLENQEIDVIKKYLHHGDVSVRMEVFSVMCSSPKKSEKVSTEILRLLKEFIGFNLNADSVAFQQMLLAQLRLLLVRIRDSSVQEYRLKAKLGQINLDLSQLEFVDWLVHTSIENTFPGACYQRRRLCLEMLNVVFDVFIVTLLGMKKKEKPSDSVKFLLKWAQDHQLLLCFKDNSLLNVLPCITDFTDEIRMLTANLIQNHCKILNAESLLEFAFSLCNNPDVRNSDSGAFVCQIIFKNMCLNRNDFNSLQDNPEFNICKSADGMNFLNQIYNIAMSQLSHAKNNLLESSLSQPLHGSLLALHHCICDSSSFFTDMYIKQPDTVLIFFQNIIQLCDDTIKYMLFSMSGKYQSNSSASFAEIGEALRDLAICKHRESSVENTELKSDEKLFELTSMSAECELLLSCCWHSIKNSCYLITELSVPISQVNMNSEMKQLLLSQVASTLSSTLISCRHRGVVDSCSSSLSKFCKYIASDKSTYEKITMKMLEEAIGTFTEESSVSVTRRSAGLPLLFQAVVSSEQINTNRKLLPFYIQRLLNIMHLPLPSTVSEKIDLPHVHAYHIMKALVTDSSLSQNILLWSNLLITTCVQGFSSPCWAIRNGALQVFGVLLPRICGQKKVRNDDSEHNSLTSSELFLRFPNLQNYLLQQLQSSVESHCKNKLSPQLIPLLLLIVKLMPQDDEHCNELADFKPLLEKLLASPVWKIRSLASTALSKFLNLEHAIALLKALKTDHIRCNWIHGVLLTVQGVLRKFKSFQISEDMKNTLIVVVKFLRENVKCNVISALLTDIINEPNVSSLNFVEDMLQQLSENCSSDSKIGHSLLMSKKTRFELNACSLSEIPIILNQQPDNDQQIQKVCLEFLSSKLLDLKSTSQCYSNENLKFWKDIFLFLVKYVDIEKHQSMIHRSLKFMIELCSDCKIGDYVLDLKSIILLDCHLQQHLDMKSGLSIAALSLTMWSLCERVLLSIQSQSCSIEKWNFIFNTYCRPHSSEILRMQAAESLAMFGPSLVEYLKSQLVIKQSLPAALNLICLCEGSLLLLQDEDEEIRNKASIFPSNIPNEYGIEFIQFNVGIKVVCQLMTDMLKSSNIYILYLWNRLQCIPSAAKVLLSCSQKKKTNLFEQEYVNVYAEPVQLFLLYQKQIIRTMTYLSKSDCKRWNAIITMMISDTMFEIEDVKSTLDYIGKENLALDFAWNHQIYTCLKKLELQMIAIQAQELLPQFLPESKNLLQNLTNKWNNVQNFFIPN